MLLARVCLPGSGDGGEPAAPGQQTAGSGSQAGPFERLPRNVRIGARKG